MMETNKQYFIQAGPCTRIPDTAARIMHVAPLYRKPPLPCLALYLAWPLSSHMCSAAVNGSGHQIRKTTEAVAKRKTSPSGHVRRSDHRKSL